MSSMAGSLIKASIRNAPTVAATAAVALVVSVASLFGGVPGGYESDSAADCAEEEDDLKSRLKEFVWRVIDEVYPTALDTNPSQID